MLRGEVQQGRFASSEALASAVVGSGGYTAGSGVVGSGVTSGKCFVTVCLLVVLAFRRNK